MGIRFRFCENVVKKTWVKDNAEEKKFIEKKNKKLYKLLEFVEIIKLFI